MREATFKKDAKGGYPVKNCSSVLDDQLNEKIGGMGGIGGMAGTGVIGPPRAPSVKPTASPCSSLTYPSWNQPKCLPE
jgi:hypothetical protein